MHAFKIFRFFKYCNSFSSKCTWDYAGKFSRSQPWLQCDVWKHSCDMVVYGPFINGWNHNWTWCCCSASRVMTKATSLGWKIVDRSSSIHFCYHSQWWWSHTNENAIDSKCQENNGAFLSIPIVSSNYLFLLLMVCVLLLHVGSSFAYCFQRSPSHDRLSTPNLIIISVMLSLW